MFINGAVVWSYAVVNLMLRMWHVPLSHGLFMHGRCQLIKTFANKEVICYFSPPIECVLQLILSS